MVLYGLSRAWEALGGTLLFSLSQWRAGPLLWARIVVAACGFRSLVPRSSVELFPLSWRLQLADGLLYITFRMVYSRGPRSSHFYQIPEVQYVPGVF